MVGDALDLVGELGAARVGGSTRDANAAPSELHIEVPAMLQAMARCK
jgi:hypothetical protein